MDVVWVVEAIASVLLNLPKFDELIAFRGAEQKVTIVLSDFILCRHHLPHTLCHSQEGTLSFVRCRSEAIIDRTGRASNCRDTLKEGYTPPRRCRSKLRATNNLIVIKDCKLCNAPRGNCVCYCGRTDHRRTNAHTIEPVIAIHGGSSPVTRAAIKSRPGGVISRKLSRAELWRLSRRYPMRVDRRWPPGLFLASLAFTAPGPPAGPKRADQGQFAKTEGFVLIPASGASVDSSALTTRTIALKDQPADTGSRARAEAVIVRHAQCRRRQPLRHAS